MTPAKTETTTGDCYLVFYQPSTACTVQPFAHFECLTPMLYVCHKMHMFFFLLCLLSETESIEPSELKKKKKYILNFLQSQVWWYTPVIPALRRLTQEDHKFELWNNKTSLQK
jgi:hypothetical protein